MQSFLVHRSKVVSFRTLLVLLTALLGSRASLAHEKHEAMATVRLVVGTENAAACLDDEALTSGVTEALGRQIFVSKNPDYIVTVRAQRQADSWRATVDLKRGSGQEVGVRQLMVAEPACTALLEHVVLTLALMLDLPGDALEPTESVRALTVAMELGGAASFGGIPETHGAARAAGGIETGNVAFWTGFSLWPTRTLSASGERFSVWAWRAELAGCLQTAPQGRSGVRGCLALYPGQLQAEGKSLELNESSRQWLLDLVLPATVRHRFGDSWGLALTAGPALALRRPRVEVAIRDISTGTLRERNLAQGRRIFLISHASLFFQFGP